jgi:hypothetical protein
MTRNTVTYPVSIGNGLYARTRRAEGTFAAYRRMERTCKHEKRDPNGTCYHCGLRMPCDPEPGCVEICAQ